MGFKLSEREIMLALALAFLGFALSSRQWLLFLNSLNPLHGLMVYYVILYLSLYVLSRVDLVIFGVRIKDASQTFGLLLITFAFFIVAGWESAYVQWVTMGNVEGASVVLLQSEDGAVFWVYQQLLPAATMETLRLLTYVFTPFLLCLIGGCLVSGRIRMAG